MAIPSIELPYLPYTCFMLRPTPNLIGHEIVSLITLGKFTEKRGVLLIALGFWVQFWMSNEFLMPLFNIDVARLIWNDFTAGVYLLKVNNRNTRTRREICSQLTIKTLKRRLWRRSGVFTVNFELKESHWRRSCAFIVNFEHISHLALVFLLLTLNMWLPAWLLLIREIL